MNPAAPVTHTFAMYPPSGRRRDERETAVHPTFRRVQLVAIARLGIELVLTELHVLAPHRVRRLRALRQLLAVALRHHVGLATADLVRQLDASVSATGRQRKAEHADEQP